MTDIHNIQSNSAKPELTVLVATDQNNGAAEALSSYRSTLDALGKTYEALVIVNGSHSEQMTLLDGLSRDWPELTVIGQRPWGGEDAALATGLRRSSGEFILLLPGWAQIEPDDISVLFEELGSHDMVSAVRSGETSSGWQGFRGGVFRRTLQRLFGFAPSDPFCRARLVRRGVLENVASFGVRQHFLPVIAAQRGYSLTEAEVRLAAVEQTDKAGYVFKPLGHMRAMLDTIALYVVLKFLRRPLRFFGAIGLPIFLIGAIMTTVLAISRIMGETALSERPILIFAVMMVVLGIQILAIGLVGEIIIFSGARRMKQYEVAEIVTSGHRGTSAPDPDEARGDLSSSSVQKATG